MYRNTCQWNKTPPENSFRKMNSINVGKVEFIAVFSVLDCNSYSKVYPINWQLTVL